MIDRDIFGRMMTAFGQRIGKPLGADASAMYYAALSARLTTEEFQHAMQRTFAGHTFATWPAPDDIIAHAKPAARLEASAEWERLASALRYRDDTRPLIPQLRSAGLADATVATFLTIGGLGRWRSANDFRFEEMRAEFLETFGDMRALPAVDRERLTAPVAPALPRGPAPLSQIAAPVAALHRPAPYSPGDPE